MIRTFSRVDHAVAVITKRSRHCEKFVVFRTSIATRIQSARKVLHPYVTGKKVGCTCWSSTDCSSSIIQATTPLSTLFAHAGEMSLLSCVTSTSLGIFGRESPSSTNLERNNDDKAPFPPLNPPSTFPRCIRYSRRPIRVS